MSRAFEYEVKQSRIVCSNKVRAMREVPRVRDIVVPVVGKVQVEAFSCTSAGLSAAKASGGRNRFRVRFEMSRS